MRRRLVRRSSKDLEITCAAGGQPEAKARLVSRANMGLAGNIVAGGAVGAMIDHNTVAAYTYPTWVRMVFGQFHVFDRRDEHEGTAMLPPGAVLSQGAPVRVDAAATPAVQRIAVEKGDTFDYRLIDRTTGQQQIVVLRAERVEAGQLEDGAPEHRSGLPHALRPGRIHGRRAEDGRQRARAAHRAHGLRGWIERHSSGIPLRASYQAVAWVSPELGRVVGYEVKPRSAGNMGGSFFVLDETAELVRVGRD